MNLFVGCMLVLVLAMTCLCYTLAGGVGLCSYLLIGFHYKDPASIRASKKALIVTRIGRPGVMIGLFPDSQEPGTLQVFGRCKKAATSLASGVAMIPCAVSLLLINRRNSVNPPRSLQVWLPTPWQAPRPQRAHPCGHHGHRGRLPDSADARPLPALARGHGHDRLYRRRKRSLRRGARRLMQRDINACWHILPSVK